MLAHGRCYGSRHGCPRRAAADAFSHFLAGFAFCTARGCDFCKQQFAHKSWCRQQPPGISPARLLPPGNDGRTGKLSPCTTGGLCHTSLAACKALASCSSGFVCRKHSHWCLVLRAVQLRRVALRRCAGCWIAAPGTPSSRLLQSTLQTQHSLHQQPWPAQLYASSSCRAGPSSACFDWKKHWCGTSPGIGV